MAPLVSRLMDDPNREAKKKPDVQEAVRALIAAAVDEKLRQPSPPASPDRPAAPKPVRRIIR